MLDTGLQFNQMRQGNTLRQDYDYTHSSTWDPKQQSFYDEATEKITNTPM